MGIAGVPEKLVNTALAKRCAAWARARKAELKSLVNIHLGTVRPSPSAAPIPLLLPSQPWRAAHRRFSGGGTVVVDEDSLFVSFITTRVRAFYL
jgi:hypothetical protein